MEDDDYDNDAYDDDDYDDDDYNTTTINIIVEECERDLHLLWETFLSLSTNHTSIGHRLDHVACTTNYPLPFKLVGPTPPGGSTLHLRVE